jgi:hypothetical protein
MTGKTTATADGADDGRFCDGVDDMIDRAFSEARLPLVHECEQHPEIDAGDQ